MSEFAAAVTDRRALAELVKSDPSVAKAHGRVLETLERWWQENLSLVEELAADNGKRGNVYDLRRRLLASIAETFAGQSLLTDHQIRGAFARYMDDLKADLKSIAASGWGAELIPDDDILQSQFPELLAEMDPRFIVYTLNTPESLRRCELVSGGTTRQRISRSNLGQVKLSVPNEECSAGSRKSFRRWTRRLSRRRR